MDKNNKQKELAKQPRKKQFKATKVIKNGKVNKAGRPASSSNVCLTPQFRNPVDIERLGKALVAIAMKLPDKPETAKNQPDRPGNAGVDHGLED